VTNLNKLFSCFSWRNTYSKYFDKMCKGCDKQVCTCGTPRHQH